MRLSGKKLLALVFCCSLYNFVDEVLYFHHILFDFISIKQTSLLDRARAW